MVQDVRIDGGAVAIDLRGLAGGLAVLHDGRLDGENLPIETPLGPGHGGVALRGASQLLDVRPRDPALLGDPLCGVELSLGIVPRMVGSLGAAGSVHHVGAEPHATHRLHAAADRDVRPARSDQTGCEVVRLLARTALTVDGRGGRRVGQTRAQPGIARHVGALLSRLCDATPDDLIQLRRFHTGAFQHLDLRGGEQLGRDQTGEPTIAPPDGSADGFDDDGIGHGGSLEEFQA